MPQVVDPDNSGPPGTRRGTTSQWSSGSGSEGPDGGNTAHSPGMRAPIGRAHPSGDGGHLEEARHGHHRPRPQAGGRGRGGRIHPRGRSRQGPSGTVGNC